MKRSNSADVLSRWATSSATASYPVAIAARHVQNKSRNLTGPFVVADVITGTSKAMLAPKGTLLDTRTATQDAHFTYRHPLPNDGRPVINGSAGVARFSELVDTEGDRCLPKGAAPRRHTAAAYEAEYAVLSKRLMNGYSKGNAGQSPVSKIVNPDPMPVPPAARTQRAAARRHYDSAARLLDAPAARETTKQFFAREAKARAADALGPAAGEQRVMSYASTFSRTPSALW